MANDLPTEVVSMILSNLCQTDLLSCRLVNHSWNQESLVVFRKSRFRTHLNICQRQGNAEKYIEFASAENPQLVLPIHLSLARYKMPNPRTVTSLQTLFGPNSIHSIAVDIRCFDEDDNKDVMILLSKISHALRTLEITIYSVGSTQPFLLDLMKDLVFPNVTTLKYLIETKVRMKKLQSQFILKCPKLTELCLESESPDVILPSTLQKLVLMSLKDTLKFENNILECSSRIRIQILKIYKYKSGDREIMVSILECLTKTLKSLTICVDPMFQFPRLPCLEYLRLRTLKMLSTISPIRLNPHYLHLNSEKFPSLKYVGIPFIFSFSRGSPLASVKTLTLSVSANSRNPYINPNSVTHFSMQDNFKNLKIIFPNATTICLKQKILEHFQCKTVLKELICSDLAQQIEQIQIKGAETDILGETLEQNNMPPEISMKYSGNRDHETEALIQKTFELWTGKIGVKGIEYKDAGTSHGRRIIVFSEGTQSGHKMTNTQKVKIVFRRHVQGVQSKCKLNLMSIAKNLPGLTEIEIFGIRNELYLKQFNDLAIEYPNVNLRITKLGSKN